jgi:hypothetical protein
MIKRMTPNLAFKRLHFFETRFGKYLDRLGTATSVFLNVLVGGSSNQTLSARNWERKRRGQRHIVPVINFLFQDWTHCLESWCYWRVRKDVQHHIEQQKLLTLSEEASILQEDSLKRKYDE